MRIQGLERGPRPVRLPAIMAADGHLRAVGQPGGECTVKTKKQKGHSGISYAFIDVVILRTVHWLAWATGSKGLVQTI